MRDASFRLGRRAVLGGIAGAGLVQPLAHAQAGIEQVTLSGDLAALIARPLKEASAGLVLLSDDAGDVVAQRCHRLSEAGYLIIAPRPDFAAEAATRESVGAGAQWLLYGLGGRAGLGLIGFGAGGSTVWHAATQAGPFKAAVAWSGRIGSGADLTIPLLGLYGGSDPAVSRAALLHAESTATAAKRTAEMVTYAGSGPDFPDGRTPTEQAAMIDAWTRTLAWFRRYGVA